MEELFERIYVEVNKQSKGVLEEAKSTLLKSTLITLAIIVVVNIVVWFALKSTSIELLSVMISVTILAFVYGMGNKNYREIYKDVVIKNLTKAYNNKMYFDSKYGINNVDYKISNFDRNFNDYHSEDRIFGKLEDGSDFQTAEVTTAIIETKNDGKHTYTERRVTFTGLYGIIRLKRNLLIDVLVLNNSHLNRFDKDRIEIDSSEFEEFYDLITKDKLIALKVFTPEIIEKFNDLRREHPKYPFELKIVNDMIFYRFKCGSDLFEPPFFKSSLDRKSLERYFKLIYYPLELANDLVKSINNVED